MRMWRSINTYTPKRTWGLAALLPMFDGIWSIANGEVTDSKTFGIMQEPH